MGTWNAKIIIAAFRKPQGAMILENREEDDR
jgi:hypothetical protein